MVAVEPSEFKGGSRSMLVYDNAEQKLAPASVRNDGMVMTEWELTEEEQERLFMGGRVRIWMQLPPELMRGALPMVVEATAEETQ